MRITCPNCGAQYEVDDALIPESGRDVQCSNCGRGWFQKKQDDVPEEAAVAASAEGVRPDPDFDATEPENEPPVTDNTFGEADRGEKSPVEEADAEERVAEKDTAASEQDRHPEPAAHVAEAGGEAAPAEHREAEAAEAASDVRPRAAETGERVEPDPVATEPEPGTTSVGGPHVAEDEGEPAPAAAEPQAPRQTDENVLAVLREEAEREITARRTEEAPGLETQPDLGLEETPERGGTPATEAAQAAAVASGARRDLLPDIDEINSSLRSDSDRAAEGEADDAGTVVGERRRGFRLGFGLMILIAAAMIALYVTSDWLVVAVPSLEPFVIDYVDWVNGVRDWFDGVLEAGVAQLSQ